MVYDVVQCNYKLIEGATSLIVNNLLIREMVIGRTHTYMFLGLSLRKALEDLSEKSPQVPATSSYEMDAVALEIFRHQRISLVLISCFFHNIWFVIDVFLYWVL